MNEKNAHTNDLQLQQKKQQWANVNAAARLTLCILRIFFSVNSIPFSYNMQTSLPMQSPHGYKAGGATIKIQQTITHSLIHWLAGSHARTQ